MTNRATVDLPPHPARATPRESAIVQQFHRIATATEDEAIRPALAEGLALMVELIEARSRPERKPVIEMPSPGPTRDRSQGRSGDRQALGRADALDPQPTEATGDPEA